MNPGEKAVLKGQLSAVGAMLGAVSSQASSGAAMPIMTPSGPAAAPGLMQIGGAISQQVQATGELIKVLNKLIDTL